MTDTKLPMFEDQDVTLVKVRITRAGDGLSDALKVTPEALHLGDEVFYVLRGEVTQINHQRKDFDEPIVRVHTIAASAITKVEAKLANKLLATAAEDLEKAKAAAAGQLMLEEENAAAEREARD